MKKAELIKIMKEHGAASLSMRPSVGNFYRAYLIESKKPIDALENLINKPGPVCVEPRYDCFPDENGDYKAVPYDGPGWDPDTPDYDGDWYAYRVTPPDSWIAELEAFSAGLVSC